MLLTDDDAVEVCSPKQMYRTESSSSSNGTGVVFHVIGGNGLDKMCMLSYQPSSTQKVVVVNESSQGKAVDRGSVESTPSSKRTPIYRTPSRKPECSFDRPDINSPATEAKAVYLSDAVSSQSVSSTPSSSATPITTLHGTSPLAREQSTSHSARPAGTPAASAPKKDMDNRVEKPAKQMKLSDFFG